MLEVVLVLFRVGREAHAVTGVDDLGRRGSARRRHEDGRGSVAAVAARQREARVERPFVKLERRDGRAARRRDLPEGCADGAKLVLVDIDVPLERNRPRDQRRLLRLRWRRCGGKTAERDRQREKARQHCACMRLHARQRGLPGKLHCPQ